MSSFQKSLVTLLGLLVLVIALATLMPSAGADTKEKGPREFYLTKTAHTGAEALTACSAGYHMASLWEIFDPTNLKYNTALGLTHDDSGSGPPSFDADTFGWVRTGANTIGTPGLIIPGEANCLAWTTTAGHGTVTGLYARWNEAGEVVSPWRAGLHSCFLPRSVWCVQD